MRIITLGSGAGTCGKTFVAANLGLALARRGVRTCLVDLDLGAADLHLRLGLLRPQNGLLQLLRGTASSLAEVVVPVDDDGMLQLIPGAGETVRGLAPEEVEGLIEDIALLPVDVAIVDLAAGLGPQELDLFLSGDAQWVVAREDARSLIAAAQFVRRVRLRRAARGGASQTPTRPKVYSSLDALVRDMTATRRHDVLSSRGAGTRPELLLTCAGTEVLDLSAEDELAASAALGLPLAGRLPFDASVDRSIADLRPVLDTEPKAPVSRALEDLAARIAPKPAADRARASEVLEPTLA
jgi:flagellar biosynthesis protein FlhG